VIFFVKTILFSLVHLDQYAHMLEILTKQVLVKEVI